MNDFETADPEAVRAEVRERGDRADALARSAAPALLAPAEELYLGRRKALSCPEAFARGGSRSETRDLVERSIRAEFAVAMRVSERVASRELESAQLLVEELPRTRAALSGARIRWEAGLVICRVAASLPLASRAAFDERAAELAEGLTPTQLGRALGRLREQLHEQPIAERHARAREDRAVWVTPDVDGMATLCVLGAATAVMGAYDRADRMARSLRDGGDERTLAQLRADVVTDLLCDGDVVGTFPNDVDRADPTFVPGVRAEVRVTMTARTALGLDDAPADLDDYGPIPADAARSLAFASITRIITEPDTGAVVSVGRTHRLPPARMRLHLQLRDQTCRHPGCTRPAVTAEADHTVEWRNGGETSLENLASLCASHHHLRHGDRWRYALRDGVTVWTTPPAGRSPPTRPASRTPSHHRARASTPPRHRSDTGSPEKDHLHVGGKPC
ncbi:HNH endonuclease signature motif containing protein [Rathayibacter sp. VKM Ac-2857]|uniref:HNH endonuclease signature motif containing protein n=1 Tax=Rathayibacter sp. VKM Ac-2857 TaxID=2739020 RepID=UPI001563FB01|nr:HNH endonuclease signature motif containing protein [Rathayibacter sp. VKM Ac-2857]NQX18126.1 DUF222 domain-containing protein [Rathayibacter sp. VKM Ac-2857]